jgi:hypothetical protein
MRFEIGHAILAVFLTLLGLVLVPSIISEPYGRVYVGQTLDTGSRLFSLLFPTALFAIILFVGLCTTVYLGYKNLKELEGFSEFFERLLPSGSSFSASTSASVAQRM